MHDFAPPPYRLNAALAATAFVLAVLMLCAVPLVLLPQAPVTAGVLVALLALATPFNTAVLHEAIHGRIAKKSAWNDRIGRALGICSGVSFEVVRFAHLTHHRFNRHALDRPDVIEPGQSPIGAGLKYYAHLFGGLYFGEIVASLAMLLPRRAIDVLLGRAMAKDEPEIVRMQIAAQRVLDRRLARVRLDAVLAIFLYAGAFALYDAWWPLLLAGIGLRGFIVSLQDNAPHYGTPAVIGATAHNANAPRWMAMVMLNQNLHAVHHDRPELHWNALPGAVGKSAARFSGPYLALLLRQFRGPRRSNAAIPAE